MTFTLFLRAFLLFGFICFISACGGGGGGGGEKEVPRQFTAIPSHFVELNSEAEDANIEVPYIHTYDEETNQATFVDCDIIVPPNHGVAEPAGSGVCKFHYTPSTNFIGDDSFTVTVTGGQNNSEVTVPLTVRLVNLQRDSIISQEIVKSTIFLTANSSSRSHIEYVTAATGLGDFNGDGVDDFVIRSQNGVDRKLNAAVIYGQEFNETLYDFTNLDSDFDGDLGFHFLWDREHLTRLASLNYLGDLNNDGFNDLAIGDSSTLVIWGGNEFSFLNEQVVIEQPHLASYQLDFNGPMYQTFDYKSFGLGDINGDGIDDMGIASVYFWTSDDRFFVVPGSSDFVEIPDISFTTNLYSIDAPHRTFNGKAQSGAGDINGDGFNDIVVSGYLLDSAHIIYGSTDIGIHTPLKDLLAASPAGAFKLPATGVFFGTCINILKDIDGDGYDEVSVGTNSDSTSVSGYIELVFGSPSFEGFYRKLTIEGSDVCISESVGDVNGDGFNDFVVLDKDETSRHSSTFYLIYGAPTFPDKIDLSEPSDRFVQVSPGRIISIKSAGDINTDGKNDILIASAENDGAVFLIYGGDYFRAPMLD